MLRFATSTPGPLSVDIYDIAGRQVRSLANDGQSAAGTHQFPIDGRDGSGRNLAAGMYLYRIRAVEGVSVGHFVIVR